MYPQPKQNRLLAGSPSAPAAAAPSPFSLPFFFAAAATAPRRPEPVGGPPRGRGPAARGSPAAPDPADAPAGRVPAPQARHRGAGPAAEPQPPGLRPHRHRFGGVLSGVTPDAGRPTFGPFDLLSDLPAFCPACR